ncbi:flagellar biosynthetic protein FliO [Herbaspirillum lusitanum]|uniref:Flagellar protein n=2 Tax=Herbaspirillum lusitanum TaxID=213312 RepID=A0ABW9A4E9_9BURK
MQTLALAADATVSGPGAAAAVTAPATPSATTVAANSSMPSPTGSVFTMMLGLIAVLAIMAAIAWLFKRAGLTQGLSGNSAAKIIGGVSVGTRERVMVIEVADQWIVVGVAPGRVNALATMPRQEHAAPANTPVGAGFSSWLKQTMDKRNQGHQGNSSGSNS